MGNTGDVYAFLGVSVLQTQADPPTWEAMIWQRGKRPLRFHASTQDGAWKLAGQHLAAMADAKREAAEVAV